MPSIIHRRVPGNLCLFTQAFRYGSVDLEHGEGKLYANWRITRSQLRGFHGFIILQRYIGTNCHYIVGTFKFASDGVCFQYR